MKILRLTSSFKSEASLSLQLGDAIVGKIINKYPQGEVSFMNLAKNELPHLNEIHFKSFFTALADLSPEQQNAVSYSNYAVDELLSSDILVIDVPMYNFGIPSNLKAWVDHIVRAGVTFRYTENGVEGLAKGKKAFLSIASGGIYSDGAMVDDDFTEKYLRKILGFIGITDISVFRVEGTAIPEQRSIALEKALGSVSDFVLTD